MMKMRLFMVLASFAALAVFCVSASSSSYASQAAPTSLQNIILNESPEFFHPLGQTRVDVVQQSGLVANPQYGAIKFVGDTVFKAETSLRQTATLNNHPVFASQSGYFYMHGVNPDGTRRVFMKHLDGSKTFYSHINPETITFNDGAPVQKGEILGRIKGEQFGFSIVDRNNISKTSSFETVEGKQLTSFSVNIVQKYYGFIRDVEPKKATEVNNCEQVQDSASSSNIINAQFRPYNTHNNSTSPTIRPTRPYSNSPYYGNNNGVNNDGDGNNECLPIPAEPPEGSYPSGPEPDDWDNASIEDLCSFLSIPCPPVQVLPTLCELVECPELSGPTQGILNVIYTAIKGRDYPKPYEELNHTNSYNNSPENLKTDYCPPVVRRALNERQTANIDADEQRRRGILQAVINFKQATCFEHFRARILGPISEIFSQGGGNDSQFLEQILQLARELGISIPLIDGQLPGIGNIMDIFNNFLSQGCNGNGSLSRILEDFRRGYYPSAASYSNSGLYGGWKTKLSELISRPDPRHVTAAALGRFYDETRFNNMDAYILRRRRCGLNPSPHCQ